jgi:hypothetical protein
MKIPIGWTAFFVFFLLVLADARVVQAQQTDTKDAIPVVRTLSGHFTCESLNDGSDCGDAHWITSIQSDGSRILREYQYTTPKSRQNTTILRVDDNFRPLDGFTHLYADGQFFGSALFQVKESTLSTTVNTLTEQYSEQITVPTEFSLLLYPISAYGWLLANYDHDKGGAQLHSMCAAARSGRGPSCTLVERDNEYLGRETITVPAGTFEADHYKLGSSGDTWVTGPDFVVVQHQHSRQNLRFQLAEYDVEEHY